MREFGDWFDSQGWIEERKEEMSQEKFKELYSCEFGPSYECVCGRYHTLQYIQSIWGWDSQEELVEYLENNKLYMGCSEWCIP
jgi:hypothetical protein